MESKHHKDISNQKEEYTLSAIKANIYGVVGMIPAIVVVYLYLYIYGIQAIIIGLGNLEGDMILLIVLLLVGTVMHEGLHGFTWSRFGHISMEEIQFGMHWKLLTPYAHCKVPLNVKAYRWGVIMPGLVVGFIPAAIGIAIQSPIFLWFGALFIMGAGGDFLTLWLLRKVPGDYLVEDHPTKVGCFAWKALEIESLTMDNPAEKQDYVHFGIPEIQHASGEADS
ncbi:MAG TPA: DUF3267 domain-containing protein [Balneolales bacterium]|jgi:hypothetical protein|nr:DUF3267 domain-containing protein [Balneolales bacterium]